MVLEADQNKILGSPLTGGAARVATLIKKTQKSIRVATLI